MGRLWEEFPDTYLMSAHTIRANLATVLPPVVYRPVGLDAFLPPWNEPFDFNVDNDGAPSAWRRP